MDLYLLGDKHIYIYLSLIMNSESIMKNMQHPVICLVRNTLFFHESG